MWNVVLWEGGARKFMMHVKEGCQSDGAEGWTDEREGTAEEQALSSFAFQHKQTWKTRLRLAFAS
jgi:hypothetical protein